MRWDANTFEPQASGEVIKVDIDLLNLCRVFLQDKSKRYSLTLRILLDGVILLKG